jgi:hypothetical protein
VIVGMDWTGSWQRPVQSYSEQESGSPVSAKGGEFLFQLDVLATRGLRSNLRASATHIQETMRKTYIPFLLWYIVMYLGSWPIITGSGSDDWVYWHFFYNHSWPQTIYNNSQSVF